jgi:hypothetical protein
MGKRWRRSKKMSQESWGARRKCRIPAMKLQTSHAPQSVCALRPQPIPLHPQDLPQPRIRNSAETFPLSLSPSQSLPAAFPRPPARQTENPDLANRRLPPGFRLALMRECENLRCARRSIWQTEDGLLLRRKYPSSVEAGVAIVIFKIGRSARYQQPK